MNKLNERETKLVGLLLVVAASIPFFVLTMPAWNEYTQTISLTSKNNSKASNIKFQISKLEKLKGENKTLEKKINIRKAYLAKSYEIDFLVQDLKNICNESSITLESFTPTEPEPINIVLQNQVGDELAGRVKQTKAYKKQRKQLRAQSLPVDVYKFPIEVKVTGNFTDILELFKKLETYGRVISVDNIAIGKIQSRRKGGSRLSKSKSKKENTYDGTLFSTFNLIAYSLPDRDEVLPFTSLERSARQSFKYKKPR